MKSPEASAPPAPLAGPAIGLIIIGDEIMSGKRVDKHMPAAIERLRTRGLDLAYAHYVGDSPARIEQTLRRAFDSGDIVFSCGGIGATPDDHTRQCAAQALGVPLELHPEARELILGRMRDMALEQGLPFVPERPDNLHRLHMGMFPRGAQIIPNPYNKIPGFSCSPVAGGALSGAAVHFVPGFPVMAWPMIEWVLDTHHAHLARQRSWTELSIIVMGAMEAALTPLMESIERQFAGVKVFSLPSVDHPQYGRHIELGVKGDGPAVSNAFTAMKDGLRHVDARLGPELVRN